MIQMKWTEEDLRQMLDYLRQKANIFKEVRGKFNIGEELGLASVPELQDFCDGILAKIKLREFAKLPEDRIVVKPRPRGKLVFSVCGSKHVYFVSVYFSPGIMENKRNVTLDENYFQAADEVITGLFAHECAEYLCHHNRKLMKSESRRILEKEIYPERFPRRLSTIRFHLLNQCPADLLASISGYKREMLAYLRFLRDKYLQFENFSRIAEMHRSYRPPRELAVELQIRINLVELVAPKSLG